MGATTSLLYGSRMAKGSGLTACPFCREMFVADETRVCPDCGIPVRDIVDLPPSDEAARLTHEEAAAQPIERQEKIADAEMLPWKDMGRGRGILLLAALGGLLAFYLPWAIQTLPFPERFDGHDLARKQSYFWVTFTSWLILFPAVLTRRTIRKMLGARVALVTLSFLPAMWCGFLLSRPTRLVVKGLPFEYHWGPGFHATWVLSLVATVVSFRFGHALGRAADSPSGRKTRGR